MIGIALGAAFAIVLMVILAGLVLVSTALDVGKEDVLTGLLGMTALEGMIILAINVYLRAT